MVLSSNPIFFFFSKVTRTYILSESWHKGVGPYISPVKFSRSWKIWKKKNEKKQKPGNKYVGLSSSQGHNVIILIVSYHFKPKVWSLLLSLSLSLSLLVRKVKTKPNYNSILFWRLLFYDQF